MNDFFLFANDEESSCAPVLARAVSERAACVPQCEHLRGADDAGAVQKHLRCPPGPYRCLPRTLS